MYLCKKIERMKLFRKCISVFLAVLFLAYSGGIGFSLHNCEHCHQVEVYVFQHPDCCPASEAEHHHGKQIQQAEHNTCCAHAEEHSSEKISPDATTAHCEQCCVSDFQFYKISSQYVFSQYDKIIQQAEDCPIVLFDLLWEENQASLAETKISTPLEEIPPLLPGGDSFLVFSHQLLFYA